MSFLQHETHKTSLECHFQYLVLRNLILFIPRQDLPSHLLPFLTEEKQKGSENSHLHCKYLQGKRIFCLAPDNNGLFSFRALGHIGFQSSTVLES